MHWTIRAAFCCLAMLSPFRQPAMSAQTNPFTKGQVADRIRKVEDGVDEFEKYLDNRGDDAKDRAQSAQNSGATSRRQRGDSTNTQNRKDQANQTKDDLEDAMDDLNCSTNLCVANSTPPRTTSRQKYNINDLARCNNL